MVFFVAPEVVLRADFKVIGHEINIKNIKCGGKTYPQKMKYYNCYR